VGAEEVAPIPLLNPVGGCGSTWRAVKREHCISVSSAVTSLEYEGLAFNLLDTLGHQDFSEVTHRALTAVDSTVMVLDAAKSMKEQTRKLFEVCGLRRCRSSPLSTSWPQSATRSTSSRAPPRP
jgi:peptide subunit release factor RF-3